MAAAEHAADGRTNLQTRLIAALALSAAALVALLLGGMVFWAFIAAMAVVVMLEWAGLSHASGVRAGLGVLALGAAVLLAAPMLWGTDRTTVALDVSLGIVVAAVVGNARLGFGVAYVGVAAIGILFLRGLPHGLGLALWTLMVVILTDTGAYFSGRALGGPLLAPRISPKKTWAGLIGGVLAAAAGGAVVALIGHLPAATLWLGAPLAVLAQAGDLYESWLKRQAGVKDSGRWLPGHGGFLDRVDGAVPVVIVVAALVAGGAF